MLNFEHTPFVIYLKFETKPYKIGNLLQILVKTSHIGTFWKAIHFSETFQFYDIINKNVIFIDLYML